MAQYRNIVVVVLAFVGVAVLFLPVMAAGESDKQGGLDTSGDWITNGIGTLLEQKGPVVKTLQRVAAVDQAIKNVEEGARNIPLVGPEVSNWIKSVRQWAMSGGIPSGRPAAGSGSRNANGIQPPVAGTSGSSGPGTTGMGSGSGSRTGNTTAGQPSAGIAFPVTTPPSSQGSIGYECWEDNTCFQGDCVNSRCVPCGRWGQRACTQQSPACEQRSTVVNGFCRIQSEECGHSGNPPCTKDRDEPFCYSGVYNAAAGICQECGDYRQPCCRDTSYPCDYGTCMNGICDKTSTSSGTGITGGTGTSLTGGIAGSICSSPSVRIVSMLLATDSDAVRNGKVDLDHCYQAVAVQFGDLSLCNSIDRGAPMTKCYLMIAEKNGDSSICRQIPMTKDTQGYLPIDCQWAVAIKTGDPAVCREMGTTSIGRMGTGEISQTTCLAKLAGRGSL